MLFVQSPIVTDSWHQSLVQIHSQLITKCEFCFNDILKQENDFVCSEMLRSWIHVPDVTQDVPLSHYRNTTCNLCSCNHWPLALWLMQCIELYKWILYNEETISRFCFQCFCYRKKTSCNKKHIVHWYVFSPLLTWHFNMP